MSKSEGFKKKVEEIQSQLEKMSTKANSKEKCIPTMLIAGVVTPLLLFMLLFFLKPSFVQKKDGNRYERDNTKVFYWTVLATGVVWISMYLYTYCSGYQKGAMLCARK